MLICSGNDAAVAIAEHIGGTVERFCEMMNDKAIEMEFFQPTFKSAWLRRRESLYNCVRFSKNNEICNKESRFQ